MPVDLLAQSAANKRSEHRTEIDAHIEDRERSVPPGPPFLPDVFVSRSAWIRIQVTDHRADIWLEEACAKHDEQQAKVEAGELWKSDQWRGQCEVSRRDDNATDEHCLALTPQIVGDPAAG